MRNIDPDKVRGNAFGKNNILRASLTGKYNYYSWSENSRSATDTKCDSEYFYIDTVVCLVK